MVVRGVLLGGVQAHRLTTPARRQAMCLLPPASAAIVDSDDAPGRGVGGSGKESSVSGSDSLTALVTSAAAGDSDAWVALVDRFENLIWSVGRAHRLDTADAADVVQTTWLRLLENLGKIHDPERLAGWLVTTARHECLRILRKAGREVLDDTVLDVVDLTTPAVDAGLLESERDEQLWASFGRLTERCQRLLRILMAADAPAYTEVSVALDMPIGAIGPTRMRCLDKLRTLTADDHLMQGST